LPRILTDGDNGQPGDLGYVPYRTSPAMLYFRLTCALGMCPSVYWYGISYRAIMENIEL